MAAREVIILPRSKCNIMEASGVRIISPNPGIAFAIISHPNSIKTLNSFTRDIDSIYYFNLVPVADSIFLISSTD